MNFVSSKLDDVRLRNSFGLFLSLLIVFTFCFQSLGDSTTAVRTERFLSLERIEKGMEGTGRTVVQGAKISTFDVEVIGVIDKPGNLEDFIIIRASGPAIEESGGISQGMSGSPVYIDGKLIGALSRAATWSRTPNRPMGLVTPIFTMLELMKDRGEAKTHPSELSLDEQQDIEQELEKICGSDCEVNFSNFSRDGDVGEKNETITVYPLRSPLMVSGLNDHSFSALKNGLDVEQFDLLYSPLPGEMVSSSGKSSLNSGLKEFNFTFHEVSGTNDDVPASMELRPGAPFGVGLTRGDVGIGALGTVTYTQNDSVLGFGHRFLLNGPSSFFLTKAHVFDTVESLESSFKLGVISEHVGAITQDRTQGVLGQQGLATDFVNIDLTIEDKNRSEISNFSVDAVSEPQLVGPLTLPVVMEAIDRSLNRIGPGTAKITYSIQGEGMPKPLKRSDIFFSVSDVSQLPSLQLAIIVDVLAHNFFKEPGLARINVDVEVAEKINSGVISWFATDKNVYYPGDLLAYQVKVNNYRDELVKRNGILKLPDNLSPGEYVVAVYGGPRPVEIAPPQDLTSFEDLISYIENLRNYEHLSVELLKPLKEQVVPISSSGYRYLTVEGVNRSDQTFSDRVVYGREAVSIIVKEKPEESSDSTD